MGVHHDHIRSKGIRSTLTVRMACDQAGGMQMHVVHQALDVRIGFPARQWTHTHDQASRTQGLIHGSSWFTATDAASVRLKSCAQRELSIPMTQANHHDCDDHVSAFLRL